MDLIDFLIASYETNNQLQQQILDITVELEQEKKKNTCLNTSYVDLYLQYEDLKKRHMDLFSKARLGGLFDQ